MTNPPDREVAVFTAAITLAAARRAAYLDQACAGDNALRLKIEALLRVHDDVGDFLENRADAAGPSSNEAAPPGPRGTRLINPAPVEKVGARIGRYKLREKIGEGGCGIVYVADQEEPVRRRVALKVIKLGMDTNSVIARFEAERQALAHHQLHQDAEARAALAQGRQVNKTLTDIGWVFVLGKLDGNVANVFPLFDGVFGQMMLNEASALIEGRSPAGGEGYAAARCQLAQIYAGGTFPTGTNQGVAQSSTEAAKWYRKASDGGNIKAMNQLAWLLATSTDARMRNGAEAVAVAEKAVAATSRTNGWYLDTLAASYAETGEFEKAVRVQKEVIPLMQDEDKKVAANSRLLNCMRPIRLTARAIRKKCNHGLHGWHGSEKTRFPSVKSVKSVVRNRLENE